MAAAKTHRNRLSSSNSTSNGSWKSIQEHEPVASVYVHGNCLTCSSLPSTYHLHSVHKVPFCTLIPAYRPTREAVIYARGERFSFPPMPTTRLPNANTFAGTVPFGVYISTYKMGRRRRLRMAPRALKPAHHGVLRINCVALLHRQRYYGDRTTSKHRLF
jgi:hypothetical protein